MQIEDKNKDFSNEVEKKEVVEDSRDISKEAEEVKAIAESMLEEIDNAEQEQKESEEAFNKNGQDAIARPNLEEKDTEGDRSKAIYEKYRSINWNRVDVKKVMGLLAEVMLENKRLVQEKIQYQNELEEYSKKNADAVKHRDEIDKALDYIASKLFCCQPLMLEINNGVKYKTMEKADKIIKYIIQNENLLLSQKKQYVEKVKKDKVILENLRKQLYDLTLEASEKKETVDDSGQAYSEKDIKKMINLTPQSPDIIIKAIPLDKAKETFNEKICSAIVEAVGKHGISEFPEICDFCVTKGINDSKVEDAIYDLEKEKIIVSEMIKPFNRNRGVRLIKLTEDLGEKLYFDKYKEKPVEPEMEKIRRENDNYEHGYSIKDVVLQLKAFGYKDEDISMDRKKNTMTISGSITWIPDVVAKNPVSHQIEYYEVETGKTNPKDFVYKLDKAVQATNKVKVIVGNKMVADNYLEHVKNWFNSKKTQPALNVVISSFQEFKNKDKTNFRCYPKVQKEDVNITNEVLKEIQKSKTNKE